MSVIHIKCLTLIVLTVYVYVNSYGHEIIFIFNYIYLILFTVYLHHRKPRVTLFRCIFNALLSLTFIILLYVLYRAVCLDEYKVNIKGASLQSRKIVKAVLRGNEWARTLIIV